MIIKNIHFVRKYQNITVFIERTNQKVLADAYEFCENPYFEPIYLLKIELATEGLPFDGETNITIFGKKIGCYQGDCRTLISVDSYKTPLFQVEDGKNG